MDIPGIMPGILLRLKMKDDGVFKLITNEDEENLANLFFGNDTNNSKFMPPKIIDNDVF